ncbi:hypothetical protein HanXRQr2_Chr11g0513451 [Helianthus annuus]|uniref:ArgH n=1 Tax=Helianthus annuus TaxID=4232 RepID=A0A251TE51_HELAN|nr:uncharacterized protein LOC110891126 isoform X1 [Helianthus annuus]KAF5783908.1 hypothetical protein HanXRQr2_Chr11g0513451 [Helianthus annuus]KAJ0511408.1 hypothetical protein HanIR_Chr11g0551831 [Helianthus annuus]KAJ0876966.1 hypothetical protein HanPSC8_Chr11g0494721 [Helianthus annuus]
MEKKKLKHLSTIANTLLQRSAQRLEMSVSELVDEFEVKWKAESGMYSRGLVEYCAAKVLNEMSTNLEEAITEGDFSRYTFDMMLAWERPSSSDEESHTEYAAKEKEDNEIHATTKSTNEHDDISLFYSDIMPLLVDNEPSVGDDAFVWLGSLVPLVADFVNGKFTFETLTSSTMNRLHFPAYDRFLKEIDKCIKHLQNLAPPKNVIMADDEFILHVEGTASSQRVVRHIGGQSWPGRLTLTNYALYFEALGIVSYEDAIKLDLSKDIEQSIKSAATGPLGAPLFDKAIIYESSELQEDVQIEFPEMTSSTRRDHWLALVKEVMLLHKFLKKFNIESPLQAWEMHSRTILGIIRLHAARELLRIAPPDPKSFLIFALLDELPTGSNVLQEIAESLKTVDSGHPCSATSILRNLNVSQLVSGHTEMKVGIEHSEIANNKPENQSSLETAVEQVREEAKEINIAKSKADDLKDEGIGNSALVLMELVKPLKSIWPWFQEVIQWERPASTLTVISLILLVVYKEWVGKAMAVLLMWVVTMMIWARRHGVGKKTKFVVCTASDQTTMESIVSAQHGLNTVYNIMQLANIAILKIWSILLSNAPKHTDMAITAMTGVAIVLAVIPLKYIIMALVVLMFAATSKLAKRVNKNDMGNRKLQGWWDSIPVIPVEIVDKVEDIPKAEKTD